MVLTNEFRELFSIVLAASKDKVYMETVEKVQVAFHELLITESDARRKKTTVLIRAMAKIDGEVLRFKRAYGRIAEQLTLEAKTSIDSYLKMIEQEKNNIIFEKNTMKRKL